MMLDVLGPSSSPAAFIVHRKHRLCVRNRAGLDVEMEALAKKL
ncbi:hypothetical protein [Mesorhizobium sp.]|nr:hypothetical protein [Mesorhizobium sp.]